MFVCIYVAVMIVVYISTFKNDFKPEHLEKSGPFISIITGIFILLGVLGSLLNRGH